ncbi:MAG TPA: hypothetical protein VEI46_03435 [Thermodesulfovibrionales bacterium]|nr:hypothetical protein [Thermodesulfovibrionales bacterium]
MSYAEGYACDITFTINSDPYSPHRPFCVVTPVSGRFASGESAYAMVDVNTPNNGTPTQNNYLVNVIVPGCFNSTCIAQGGINIICTH